MFIKGLKGAGMGRVGMGSIGAGAVKKIALTPGLIGSIKRSPVGVLPKAIQGMIKQRTARVKQTKI